MYSSYFNVLQWVSAGDTTHCNGWEADVYKWNYKNRCLVVSPTHRAAPSQPQIVYHIFLLLFAARISQNTRLAGFIMCWVFSSSIGDISSANSSGFDLRKAQTLISLSPRKNALLGVHTATTTTLSFAEKMFFFSGSQTNNKILLCRVLKITSRRRNIFFFRLSDR